MSRSRQDSTAPRKGRLAGIARAVILALSLSLAMPLQALDAVLIKAARLLDQGNYVAATALLQPLETQRAGDPDFDYLFGIALLESGRSAHAVMALERAVITNPASAGARLELARALLASGESERAREELLRLAAMGPPPAARQEIDRNLKEIRNRDRRSRLTMDIRLSSAAGYDSNANSATTVNNFLGFTLDDASRETSSGFAELGARGRLIYRQTDNVHLDTSLALSHRLNPDASFVDATHGGFTGGIAWRAGDRAARIGVETYRLDTDGSLNSEGAALRLSWDFPLSERWRSGLFARYGIVRYGRELAVKDVNQLLFGASASLVLGDNRRGRLGTTLLAGRDDPDVPGSRYGKDLYGVRLYGSWIFSPRVRASGFATWLNHRFDTVFFEQEFDRPRDDTTVQVGASVDWAATPDWLVSGSISYRSNDSDVDLYDYDRVETLVRLSRTWR